MFPKEEDLSREYFEKVSENVWKILSKDFLNSPKLNQKPDKIFFISNSPYSDKEDWNWAFSDMNELREIYLMKYCSTIDKNGNIEVDERKLVNCSSHHWNKFTPEEFVNLIQQYTLSHPDEKIIVSINQHWWISWESAHWIWRNFSIDDYKKVCSNAFWETSDQNILLEFNRCHAGNLIENIEKPAHHMFLWSEFHYWTSWYSSNMVIWNTPRKNDDKITYPADYNSDWFVSPAEDRLYLFEHYHESFLPTYFDLQDGSNYQLADIYNKTDKDFTPVW